MHALLVEIGANKSNELRKPTHSCKRRWMELLIEKRSIRCNALLKPCNRICRCSWSLCISTRCRAYSICKWSIGKSSIRCCACACSKWDISRYRIKSCLENTTARFYTFRPPWYSCSQPRAQPYQHHKYRFRT